VFLARRCSFSQEECCPEGWSWRQTLNSRVVRLVRGLDASCQRTHSSQTKPGRFEYFDTIFQSAKVRQERLSKNFVLIVFLKWQRHTTASDELRTRFKPPTPVCIPKSFEKPHVFIKPFSERVPTYSNSHQSTTSNVLSMIPESSFPRYEQPYMNGTNPIQPSRQTAPAPYRALNHQPTNHWNHHQEPLNSYVSFYFSLFQPTDGQYYSSTKLTTRRSTTDHSLGTLLRTITLTIDTHRKHSFCCLSKIWNLVFHFVAIIPLHNDTRPPGAIWYEMTFWYAMTFWWDDIYVHV